LTSDLRERLTMTDTVTPALLWFSAIGCGMMAGLYFAFSTFIMAALARIPQASGVAAMPSINVVSVRSPFMPLFLGTTCASLALAGLALFRWGEPGAPTMFAAGVIYVVGMFGCTLVLNVPLNNALEAVDAGSAAAAPVWRRYLKEWILWNHVRTISSALACALFIAAIVAG
jgi:uncharacterized membrane protein